MGQLNSFHIAGASLEGSLGNGQEAENEMKMLSSLYPGNSWMARQFMYLWFPNLVLENLILAYFHASWIQIHDPTN